METNIKQDRIALKNLKVAQFASEETLCFTATVLFDGVAIAQARNDGRGGATFVHALEGKAAQLSDAGQFAKGLPPVRFEGGVTGQDRSEEHTSELQSLMRISYAVYCLKKN